MAVKSILEQALLQVETLEDAVKTNAKGILASTMKQELNSLLKEQEDINPEEEENDVDDVKSDDEETSINDGPSATPEELPSEETPEVPSLDSDIPSDESADDVLDMTNASEEEILKVFKAMKPEDGIVVKKDGDNVEFTDEGNEYIIKLDSEGSPEIPSDIPSEELPSEELPSEELPSEELPSEELPSDDEEEDFPEGLSEEDKSAGKEVVYEIELDDEEDGEKKEDCKECGNKKVKEGEVDESSRTQAFGYKGGLEKKKAWKAGNKREEVNEEIAILRKQNDEYKKALVLFKDKLNEVAVFNANLAYATRLFTEHSTTKQEKLGILGRFDTISTISESKNLYATINTELQTKKPITESVAAKIASTPKTSSSTEVLSESKTYENDQFKRMKDLMRKIK